MRLWGIITFKLPQLLKELFLYYLSGFWEFYVIRLYIHLFFRLIPDPPTLPPSVPPNIVFPPPPFYLYFLYIPEEVTLPVEHS